MLIAAILLNNSSCTRSPVEQFWSREPQSRWKEEQLKAQEGIRQQNTQVELPCPKGHREKRKAPDPQGGPQKCTTLAPQLQGLPRLKEIQLANTLALENGQAPVGWSNSGMPTAVPPPRVGSLCAAGSTRQDGEGESGEMKNEYPRPPCLPPTSPPWAWVYAVAGPFLISVNIHTFRLNWLNVRPLNDVDNLVDFQNKASQADFGSFIDVTLTCGCCM